MSFRPSLHVIFARALTAAVSLLLSERDANDGSRNNRQKHVFLWLAGISLLSATCLNAQGIGTPAGTNSSPHFSVSTYVVEDHGLMPTNVWGPVLSKYTGPDVSLDEIVKGATEMQAEYRNHGYPGTSIAIAQDQITSGVVTLNVFQTAIPQILVSGVRYFSPTDVAELPAYLPPPAAPVLASAPTNPPAPPPPPWHPPKPATPEQIAAAAKQLSQEMARLDVNENDYRIHVVSTNAGPRFDVEHYIIEGNTVLSLQTIAATLTNIDGAFGANVSFDGVKAVIQQLQLAYHERGYLTVAVTLPRQKLSNATVKIKVLEGRLTSINVVGNTYFSSNNVMRALPSLHTNIVIDAPVLQAELNRANANQDRQIIPVVGPGPEPGTSVLTLRVKDRFPLHAKVDLDNQSSPGTPALRVNTSAVYDNLWQRENSVGFQYGFSPEEYKQAGNWNFYDRPDVSLISGFYRLPLGNPESLEQRITANPGTFGFDEASRKFNLPPVGGVPDLTIFASRSTIDTGTADTFNQTITTNGSNPTINRQDVVHSPTINEDLAAHLDYPLASSGNLQSAFSGGLDFKFYQLINYKTNDFTFIQTNFANGNPILPPFVNTVPSVVPTTENWIEYLPLSLRYSGQWSDSFGVSGVGLGVTANLWFSSRYSTSSTSSIVSTNASGVVTATNITTTTETRGAQGLEKITGSTLSSGHWVVINPSFYRTIVLDQWTTLFRLDGQWASEPLISPEQFGAGGVNSVRGYPEGDVFGDDGWHVSLEEQTPPHTVGILYGNTPLTLRASIFMDYADVYLIDPQGRPPLQSLWGTGVGVTAAAGPHWQAQFLFSFPLNSTADTPAYEPMFNFSLTAQF
ncbi:MAG TPA: POTRA domain-containing protein [Verrucomicrobiae bacterium]|nr:POTRA domain-containing protein [Verrucomicrobiae bacterium]